MLSPRLFGTAGIPSVLFFAFQIAFWIVNGDVEAGRKHLFSNRRGFRNHSVQAAGAVILAGVFLLSMLVVNGNATWFLSGRIQRGGIFAEDGKTTQWGCL